MDLHQITHIKGKNIILDLPYSVALGTPLVPRRFVLCVEFFY